VEAADVSGVDAWWLKDGANLTLGDNPTDRKYDVQVGDMSVLISRNTPPFTPF
jgi:hypothetical protein